MNFLHLILGFAIKITLVSATQLMVVDTLQVTNHLSSANYTHIRNNMHTDDDIWITANLIIGGNLLRTGSGCTGHPWAEFDADRQAHSCTHAAMYKDITFGEGGNTPLYVEMAVSQGKAPSFNMVGPNALEEGGLNGGDVYIVGGQGGNLNHKGGNVIINGGDSYSPDVDDVHNYGKVFIGSESGNVRIGKSNSQCMTHAQACTNIVNGTAIFNNDLTLQRMSMALNTSWSSKETLRFKMPQFIMETKEGDIDVIAPHNVSFSNRKSSVSAHISDNDGGHNIDFEVEDESFMQLRYHPLHAHPKTMEISAPLVVDSLRWTTNDRRVMREINNATSSPFRVVSELQSQQFKLDNAENDASSTPTLSTGFIAQDVEKIIPHAVNNYKDTLHVQYDAVYLEMFSAVKELSVQMDMLSREIDNVKSSVTQEFHVHRHDCGTLKTVYDEHCCGKTTYDENGAIGVGIHVINGARLTSCRFAKDAYASEKCPC